VKRVVGSGIAAAMNVVNTGPAAKPSKT
jgi:hypothetical protein